MNLETFRQTYDFERSGRAFEKRGADAPEYLTADGAAFDYGAVYYFFDENALTVRETAGLVPKGGYLTGPTGSSGRDV